MSLERIHINRRAEFFEGEYGAERRQQYAAVSRLYNRTIGPVRAVGLYRPGPFDLSTFGTSCGHTPAGLIARDISDKTSALDAMAVPIGGKGPNMRQAFLGALGEGAERLLAVLHSIGISRSTELATYSELVRSGRRALGPADISLFAREQYGPDFAFVPFEADTPICWIEGHGLFDGQPIMAPAQLVLFYWNHKLREARIGYATSGGLVFHPDRKRSILYGIYENIERDAINLRWHCRMPPREVKVDLVEFLRDHAALSHPRMSTNSILPIRVLLNTLDIPIPVFSAVTLDRSRTRNMLLAGGGAWSEKERALTQAIFEIGQMQIGYKLFPRAWDNIRPNSQISELVDFYHAPIFYGSVENLPLLNWYVFDGPPVSWDEVPTIAARDVDEEWEIVMPLLRERSINPIVFDFSSACWPGLSVTKVFMPQITFAHIPSHPYFGHPRYYEVPKRVGASDRALNWSDLLTRPLPFP